MKGTKNIFIFVTNRIPQRIFSYMYFSRNIAFNNKEKT